MPPTQIVLPARLASTRLNEKLLQRVAGKSILQHTYEAASKARCSDRSPVVAVDHPRLADEVDAFGGRWIMTPQDCPSGTDRIAAVASQLPEIELFVNVQSDEPEIDPAAIDAVAAALAADPSADMATAGTPILSAAALADPAIVKIVMADFRLGPPTTQPPSTAAFSDVTGTGHAGDGAAPGSNGAGPVTNGAGQGRAVYFSRACVPHDRDGTPADRLDQSPPVYWHHLGLYAYRRAFLQWFQSAPPSCLEQIEKLEQLRAIEAGKKIIVSQVPQAQPGIDTPEDLQAFRVRRESVV